MEKNLRNNYLDTLADSKKEGEAVREWLKERIEKAKDVLSDEKDIDIIRLNQGVVQAYEVLLKRLTVEEEKEKGQNKIGKQYL